MNERPKKFSDPGGTTGTKSKASNSEPNEPRTLTAKRLQMKLVAQNYRCHFTGLPLEPHNATLEYLIPLARGGTVTIRNVVFVRSEIAHMKGRMLPEEFVEWCGRLFTHSQVRTR